MSCGETNVVTRLPRTLVPLPSVVALVVSEVKGSFRIAGSHALIYRLNNPVTRGPRSPPTLRSRRSYERRPPQPREQSGRACRTNRLGTGRDWPLEEQVPNVPAG